MGAALSPAGGAVCYNWYTAIRSVRYTLERRATMENALVIANTRFAFKLFAQLVRQEGEKNIFISPTSIALALALICNGADGETRQAIIDALELAGQPLNVLNQVYTLLRRSLERRDPQIHLIIANALWARQGVTFQGEFLRCNQDHYGAELAELDFESPDAAAIINSWVSAKTNGKIPTIIDQSALIGAVMVLLNAIYFKGAWSFRFDESHTEERDFTLPGGRRKRHPMMSQEGHLHYYRGEGFQAVKLPFGDRQTSRMSMDIFLPDEESSLGGFYLRLNAANWDLWRRQFYRTLGTIVLPRFKLEYQTELNDALSALGMEIIFHEAADFSRMCALPVAIETVIHKAAVEVNEEGAEAAAATAVVPAVIGIFDEAEPFSMIVDRPFFFVIRDNHNDTPLFMGSVAEPM